MNTIHDQISLIANKLTVSIFHFALSRDFGMHSDVGAITLVTGGLISVDN